MIFIKVDENNKVIYKHYRPFDEIYGLQKTKEQLLQEGYLVESIPTFKEVSGKNQVLYYDKRRGFWCEYIDIPLTPEQEAQQLKERIKIMQQALDELLLGGMQ